MRHALCTRLLLVPFLLLMAACGPENAKDKYPFPPQFVNAEQVDFRVISAPPPKDSAKYKEEINGILANQQTLTEAEKSALMAEDHITPSMIIEPVLGLDYTAEKFPALFTLLKHAASDAWRLGDREQDYWHRDRPWIADKRVAILVSTITRPSYPSGHSTTNHVWAFILSDLFPEQKDAFFKRAYEIGMHRTLAGVHYPTDVEAGKKFASALYAVMQKSPAFDKEYQAASDEIAAAMTEQLRVKAREALAKKPVAVDAETPKGDIPTVPSRPKTCVAQVGGMTMCH